MPVITWASPPRTWRANIRSPATSRTSSPSAREPGRKGRAARGRFKDEIAPVTIKTRKGETVVADDEYIRAGATIESVSGVRPAFKKDGTVTAANASGLNDGAAAIVLMSREEAEKRGHPRARHDQELGLGGRRPVGDGHRARPATKRALEKAGWTIGDLDLIEANEAFAAQALSVGKELASTPKGQRQRRRDRVGHPIGASGARVLTTSDLRDAERGREEGSRHAVHRRRHGHRHVCRTLNVC